MKNRIVLVVFLLAFMASYAQKLKVESGDLSVLKGIEKYKIIFEYDSLTVEGFETEADFLKEKMEKRELKKQGDGERFRQSWFSDRKELYEPSFIKNFNGYFIMKKKIKLYKNNPSCKYTVKLVTNKIYPGYNVGVWWEESKLWATIIIFETENPKNIVLKSKEILIQGKTDYNGGVRIANSYGLLGKVFARFLRKKT